MLKPCDEMCEKRDKRKNILVVKGSDGTNSKIEKCT